MAYVRSFSLPDHSPLVKVAMAGTQKHHGTSAFVKHLIELYADALAAHGRDPTPEAFTEAYLKATVEQKRLEAAASLQEASAAEDRLAEVVEAASTSEGAYATAEALVDAFDAAAPDSGMGRRDYWTKLAQLHKFDARQVRRAAGKKFALKQAGQTNLRAIPAPKEAPR